SGTPPHKGLAWAFLRIMWRDVGSNVWNTVLPPPPPPPPATQTKLDKLTINGWIPFGDDQREGWGGNPPPPAAIGFDYYQWSTKAGATPVPVYPYFWFENLGSLSTDTVTWTVDNMTLAPQAFDAFSLMVNESGYDVASPIWAAVRPNDPALI